MVSTEFQRARRPEQKETRRESLLEAAASLLAEGGFDAVGLNAIARRAGLSKSNVYRYFESREQILLALLAEDETRWVATLEEQLAPLGGSDDVAAVGKVVAQTLAADRRLCLLTTVLATVLEQNISRDTVIAFKDTVLALGRRIGNALHAALPSLSLEAAQEAQHLIHALLAGLWPICHPAPTVREALDAERFCVFRHDFDRDLERGVTLLLRALVAEA
ncbi:MAG: TetR family transcriptional regulator [Polyangiaceae bacterium]